MNALGTITLGDYKYGLRQDDHGGSVAYPAAATLVYPHDAPRGEGLVGSVQQLHADHPQLVIYEWVEDDDRARLEAWERRLLARAQLLWRKHYDPADFDTGEATAARHGWRRSPNTWVAAFAMPLFLAFAFIAPPGTPRLVSAAIGAGIACAAVCVAYLLAASAREALRITWRVTALAALTLASIAVWPAIESIVAGAGQ